MKVKDLIIMILENKIPNSVGIIYQGTKYDCIDDLLENFYFSFICERYVSVICEEDK
jgi:hypothetical protein